MNITQFLIEVQAKGGEVTYKADGFPRITGAKPYPWTVEWAKRNRDHLKKYGDLTKRGLALGAFLDDERIILQERVNRVEEFSRLLDEIVEAERRELQ